MQVGITQETSPAGLPPSNSGPRNSAVAFLVPPAKEVLFKQTRMWRESGHIPLHVIPGLEVVCVLLSDGQSVKITDLTPVPLQ